MSEETFQKLVHVWSQAVPDLQPHLDVLAKFIYLIEEIDGLPGIERRFHREGLSFFHAISKNRTIGELKKILEVFFEDAPLSWAETTDGDTSQGVSAERLGGIQGEQVMFVKKVGEAEFYGALWPWKDKKDVVTVHLGVCAPNMTEENHQFMYSAIMGHLAETATDRIDADVSGRLTGISLASFLQMSELERSTCTLTVRAGKRTGTLHLLNGNLIDAETGSLKQRDAALTILGWVGVEIEIQKPSGRKTNEIKLPMTKILKEALKKKDESEFEASGSGPESAKLVPGKEPGPSQQAARSPQQTAPEQQVKTDRPEVLDEGSKEDAATDKAGPAELSGAGENKRSAYPTVGPIGEKRRLFPITAAVVLALLAGALVYWYMQSGRGGPAGDEYAALMNRLESVTDDAEKEKQLNAFIEAHADDPTYTDKAMQVLFDIMNRMEASEYEKTLEAVFDLPLDSQYYRKAENIFDDFLMRHPESRYRDDISKRLAEISPLADDAHFGELSELDPRDYLGRLEACSAYLNAHPEGKHREAVKQLARETLQASYGEFSIDIDRCQRRRKWDDCLTITRQYRESFQSYMNMSAVDRVEAQVLELKALDVLKAETEGADDETVRRLYLEFMKNYPDATENKRLEERVAEIDRMRSAPDEWMRLKAASRDTAISLSRRKELLRRYIGENPGGAYLTEAEDLLAKLEKQTDKSKPNGAGTGGKRAATTTGLDQGKPVQAGQEKAARLAAMRQEVSGALAKTEGRFVAGQGGTVLDKITGLSWTMLDSLQVTGHCMDYRRAEAYVERLNDGNHSDWRIPTAAELAGIYQNRPYFPAGGAEWYWSSDVYEKGYHTIAYIVYAEPEAVYKKRTAGVRKCGSVRAVRP